MRTEKIEQLPEKSTFPRDTRLRSVTPRGQPHPKTRWWYWERNGSMEADCARDETTLRANNGLLGGPDDAIKVTSGLVFKRCSRLFGKLIRAWIGFDLQLSFFLHGWGMNRRYLGRERSDGSGEYGPTSIAKIDRFDPERHRLIRDGQRTWKKLLKAWRRLKNMARLRWPFLLQSHGLTLDRAQIQRWRRDPSLLFAGITNRDRGYLSLCSDYPRGER